MLTLVWAELALPDAHSVPQTRFGVLVEGSRILETGSYDALRERHPSVAVVGGEGLLLMPAMVDSHDHGRGLGSASLGVPDDLLEIWLPGLWNQPVIDPYLAAAYDGLRLLRSGVGVVAHSHNPRDWRNMAAEAELTLRGYADAGIRVAFHPPIVDQNQLVYADLEGFLAQLPSDLRAQALPFANAAPLERADYFALCAELFARYHDPQQHNVHIQVSPAGGQWCSDELIVAAVEFARQHGTRVQMHMLETQYQRAYAARCWRTTFVRHLDEIGALGPWMTLAHMVWADAGDFALLAERGVAVAHNPSSNLRLRSGVADVPGLIKAGVTLGIGLDGHALDEDQDYLRELRLAWTLANRPGSASPTISAQQLFRMATSGGVATTFGAHAPLGRIAPGLLADLVLVDWNAVRGVWFAPWADPFEALLRRATASCVTHVMIGGRWTVRDAHSTTLDEAAIVAAIRSELAMQSDPTRRPHALVARALAPYLRQFYAAWEETK
ncbi:MAG: amidohydrolase family protein [Roseiflexaceae bacterium]|nr:amidohydrolase family protein [Roseiflexaceae bacterium]